MLWGVCVCGGGPGMKESKSYRRCFNYRRCHQRLGWRNEVCTDRAPPPPTSKGLTRVRSYDTGSLNGWGVGGSKVSWRHSSIIRAEGQQQVLYVRSVVASSLSFIHPSVQAACLTLITPCPPHLKHTHTHKKPHTLSPHPPVSPFYKRRQCQEPGAPSQSSQ